MAEKGLSLMIRLWDPLKEGNYSWEVLQCHQYPAVASWGQRERKSVWIQWNREEDWPGMFGHIFCPDFPFSKMVAYELCCPQWKPETDFSVEDQLYRDAGLPVPVHPTDPENAELWTIKEQYRYSVDNMTDEEKQQLIDDGEMVMSRARLGQVLRNKIHPHITLEDLTDDEKLRDETSEENQLIGFKRPDR